MSFTMYYFKSIIVTILVLSVLHGFAQTPPVWVGIQGGPSYNSFRGNEWTEDLYDPAVGFITGVTLDHHFSPVFSVVSSLNYEQKRTKGTLIATDESGQILGDIDYRATFQYVTWPLMARATFGDDIRFFVNGGPYLSYLLKQNEKMEATWNDLSTETDHTDHYRTLDVGLVAGIGSIFPVGEQLRITLEIRDHLGLKNISALEIADDGAIRTNAVLLLVGLSYGIGGVKSEE